MSGATYRIETAHEPNSEGDPQPWIARVYLIADDNRWHVCWAATETAALVLARKWIALQAKQETGGVYYTDDAGEYAFPASTRFPVTEHSAKV